SEKPDLTYGRGYLPSKVVMDIEKYRYENGGYTFTNERAVPLYVELLKGYDEGKISEQELQDYSAQLRATDVRQEVQRYLHQREQEQQYSLSLSGGLDKFSFYSGLGYNQGLSHVIGDENRRLNAQFRGGFRPTGKISAQLGLAYVEQHVQRNGVDYSD